MSTEYAFDPPLRYDDLKRNLPPGVTIRREYKPTDPAGRQPDGTMGRLYVPEIEHCLIEDACHNAVWLRNTYKLEDYGVERVGDALIEAFGMGGGLIHIGKAFEEAGHTLYDVITRVTWDSDPRKCVQCGETFEPIDEFIVERDGEDPSLRRNNGPFSVIDEDEDDDEDDDEEGGDDEKDGDEDEVEG